MEELQTLEEVQAFISTERLALLYISQESCSVCHALLPKVVELLKTYPLIKAKRIVADDLPEAAGYFSIFTVPAVLLFVEGKEMIRKARFIPIDELNYEIDKLYAFFND